MKNLSIKLLAVTLSATLILGASGGAVSAAENRQTEAQNTAAEAIKPPAGEAESEKRETVYILADAEGAAQQIIVSDWLHDSRGSDTLNDSSALTAIEPVKGSAAYTLGDGDSLTWETGGEDVYYQGYAQRELPVSLRISYWLDGVTIAPEELAGRSGRVTIRFDYENRQTAYVELEGVQEKLYVPFAVFTGLVLDSGSFTEVEVVNGRLMNDGDRTFVIGYAFPGLQESLGLSEETLLIPDYVEISAEVRDFSLPMTLTLVTNEPFSELDAEKADAFGELGSSMDALTDGMTQLMDGSSRLCDGLGTLLEESGALSDGARRLAEGSLALKNGAAELDAGAGELETGAAELAGGLAQLNANSTALNDGAEQVFASLLTMAQSQLDAAGLEVPELTPANYGEILAGVIATLDEEAVYRQALDLVTAAVEEQRAYITEQVAQAVKAQVEEGVKNAMEAQILAGVTEAVREQVAGQVESAVREGVAEQVIRAATGMSKADYDAAAAAGLLDKAVQTAVDAAIEEKMTSEEIRQLIGEQCVVQMASEEVQGIILAQTEAQLVSDEVQSMIAALTAEKLASEEVQALIAENTEAQVQKAISENMASEAVQVQLSAASEGAQELISLKTSLDSYNSFYLGLQAYTAGVGQAAAGAESLADGAAALNDGSAALSDGAEALYTGTLSLQSGVPALLDGITQLRDGAMELSDGLTRFNEEGIRKLTESVSGDLEGLQARLEAISAISKEYCNYSGIADGMAGQVKFIYRTEGIGG